MMTKSIIHVNQHIIRYNQKNGSNLPTITVKQGKVNRYANEVEIDGPSKMVYRPDNPLGCGARLWIETNSGINLIGETDFVSIKELMDGTELSSNNDVVE